MAPSRIAIIDDEPGQQLGSQIKAVLQRERGYAVDLIQEPLPEPADLASPPLALIIAVLPPSTHRMKQLLGALRAEAADTPFLRVRRSADLSHMLGGVLWRPHDSLLTPLRAADVRARVRRLLPAGDGQERAAAREPFADGRGLGQLVGEDPAFVAVKPKLPLLARSEAPVLLIGETGTGKELCARALHDLSCRAGKPFLAVNCGAIPVELFERELFGHERGALARPGRSGAPSRACARSTTSRRASPPMPPRHSFLASSCPASRPLRPSAPSCWRSGYFSPGWVKNRPPSLPSRNARQHARFRKQ